DMKTMEILVSIMSKVFPDFKIKWLVDETKLNLPIELDFLHEGKNCEKIAEMFKKEYKWLKVPKIYWEHSTSRVLVMEYLEGGHVTDVDYLKDNKIDPFEVSNKIGQLYSDMIFVKGFVHSDPHPGNILVKKNPETGKADIILLDHGLYANLTNKFRYEYSKLWLSILNVDRNAMKKHSMNLGIKGDLYGLFACMVTGRPWELVIQGIDKELLQNNSQMVIPQLSDVLEQVDRQMLLILKTNDLIRGIESTLGTKNRMTAFWVMSKCCVKSSYKEEISTEDRRIARWRLIFSEKWAIFKLNIYYLYLGLINYG
uniref:ABC1 atypical kinase-like domain-containing protein n=1 Tax=Megaselia scalaris TaxID=36166 RepID=T1H5S2_MEGSC